MTPSFFKYAFSAESPVPVYRQLADQIKSAISSGLLQPGDKLPPTRDLAELLKINRSTVSAAYALLEEDGLLVGQVGRGSFVANHPIGFGLKDRPANLNDSISFASSRPSQDLFPLEDFRTCGQQVLSSPEVNQILQLGSPFGYPPLRRYLIEQARANGVARKDDEIMITNGCQQALDLIERAFGDGMTVVEDPVYPGVKSVFAKTGRRCIGIPVTSSGIDLNKFRECLSDPIRLAILTPNFQNPTGVTMPIEARLETITLARKHGVQLVENNIYEQLRYVGEDVPSIKQLDESGSAIQLGSFSKIAFPGLRVGWIIGPKSILSRLAELKQACDLHSDQLSQAVLLRFAESGLMAEHRVRARAAGSLRLRAILEACSRFLPSGSTYTRPEGGMNLWVTLPDGLDTAALCRPAELAGVSYLPGKAFGVSGDHSRSLRLSFAGLTPEQIEEGMRRLVKLFKSAQEGSLPMEHAAEAVV